MIYHFPGLTRKNFIDSLTYLNNTLCPKIPDNIQIVTVGSIAREFYVLLDQLRRFDIPFINTAEDYFGYWDNTMKIDFILQGLDLCTKPYILVLDAIDVLIGDCSNIINKLKLNYPDKKAIYNASKNVYPTKLIEVIKDIGSLGEWCYLNAGVCIGELEYLKYMYNEAKEYKKIYKTELAEQALIRMVYHNNQDKIGIDNKRVLFKRADHIEGLQI